MVNFGQLSPSQQKTLSLWGYTKAISINGEVGATELAMYMGAVGWEGVAAFVRPEGYENYAYVLCKREDGSDGWIDGSFHRFEDGRFSVS